MTDLQIEAFLAVCRHKNISRAAEALYISQSSLSTRIKSLENSLGCTLLLRGKGGHEIELTARGQSFYDLAVQHEALIRRMENLRGREEEELLRVSAINSVSTYLLPPVYKRFVKKYPHIHLSIQDMEAEMASRSLAKGYTDLAFTSSGIETERIASFPLMSDPLVIVCPEQAVYREPVPLSVLSVKNEVYIRLCADQELWHSSVFGPGAIPQIKLEMIAQLGLFLSEPTDWAIVPESIAQRMCEGSGLRLCRPDFMIPERTIYVMQNRDRMETPAVQNFLEVVREEMLPAPVASC